MADYKECAKQILKEVGGPDNITSFTHCATRLRFGVEDASIIDADKVQSIKGVMGVVPQGDKAFQVIIGGAVSTVYNEINDLPEMKKGGSKELSDDEVKAAQRSKVKGKNKVIDSFFEFLSDSFRPIIGVLLGASLILAFINLLIEPFHVVSSPTDNPVVMFLNSIAQAVFVFLPVMIAYNACKKLRVDPWVGAIVMLTLFTPHFLSLGNPEMYSGIYKDSVTGNLLPGFQVMKDSLTIVTDPILHKTFPQTTLFGVIPLIIYDYSSNVFVPLMMAGVCALLDRGLKKIIPGSVQLVFVPFVEMIVMVPVTAILFGPIGIYVGSGLGMGLSWLNSNAPFIFAIAIPLLYPFLVPLGLHWPLNAIMLLNIGTIGYDFIQGPMGCWNFACFGATAGVLIIALREKNKEMSGIAGGALAAGLLGGISEPSLYGIHLRYKKVYPRILIGCAAGGVTIAVLGFIFPSTIAGAAGVTTHAFAFTSLLTIPLFNQVWVYAISIAVAFVLSMFLIVTMDYRTPEQKQEAKERALAAKKE